MGGHTLHSSIYMRCAERQTQREGRETMVAGEGEEGVTANTRPVSLGDENVLQLDCGNGNTIHVCPSHTPRTGKVCSRPGGFLGKKLPSFPAPRSALSPGPREVTVAMGTGDSDTAAPVPGTPTSLSWF